MKCVQHWGEPQERIVRWNPTFLCNKHCDYCSHRQFWGVDVPTLEFQCALIDHMSDAFPGPFVLHILGGEPTLLPYLSDMIEHMFTLLGKRVSPVLFTNGSNPDMVKKLMCKYPRLRVRQSVHLNVCPEHTLRDVNSALEFARRFTPRFSFHVLYSQNAQGEARLLEMLDLIRGVSYTAIPPRKVGAMSPPSAYSPRTFRKKLFWLDDEGVKLSFSSTHILRHPNLMAFRHFYCVQNIFTLMPDGMLHTDVLCNPMWKINLLKNQGEIPPALVHCDRKLCTDPGLWHLHKYRELDDVKL